MSDWLPTLAFAAGVQGIPIASDIDGRNQWEALQNPEIAVRNVVMNNIDQLHHYSSYVRDGWKYVNGTSWDGEYDRWLGSLDGDDALSEEEYVVRLIGSAVAKIMAIDVENVGRLRRAAYIQCNRQSDESTTNCNPTQSACLFNLLDDPCEQNNIASKHVDIVERLHDEVRQYLLQAAKPRNKPGDPRSDPAYFNNTWTWWEDELDRIDDTRFLVAIGIISVVAVILLLIVVKRIVCPTSNKAGFK